jgi:hypothetical protein
MLSALAIAVERVIERFLLSCHRAMPSELWEEIRMRLGRRRRVFIRDGWDEYEFVRRDLTVMFLARSVCVIAPAAFLFLQMPTLAAGVLLVCVAFYVVVDWLVTRREQRASHLVIHHIRYTILHVGHAGDSGQSQP